MDEKIELTAYEQDFINVLDEIKELFLYKNRAYNGENPFANFMVGGLLICGDSGFLGRFEALKAYTTKHIANVYTHNINMPGLDEPMLDIATYMIIGAIMKRQHDLITTQQIAAKNNASEPVTEEPATPTTEEPIAEELVSEEDIDKAFES